MSVKAMQYAPAEFLEQNTSGQVNTSSPYATAELERRLALARRRKERANMLHVAQPEQQAAQRIIYAVQTGLELSGDGRDPDSGEYDKGQGTT